MPTVSVLVPSYELDDLFQAVEIWAKARDGRLVEREEPRARDAATADWCRGGESYYTRLFNREGVAIARVHHLECPDGRHEVFPSALKVGDTTIYRVGHQDRS